MTDFSICLFFALFLHKAVCLKFKGGGDFILLDDEPENLLYENTFVHEWHLCRVNTSVISPFEYDKKGYISDNCSNKNWDNKHPFLKYAWFYAGVPYTEIPTCDPLSAADSYLWNCEKNLLPNEVTPYRNCTPVCNKGYTLQHNVTIRCSVNLTWTWFGDKDRQFCEKTHLQDFTQTPSDRFPSSTIMTTSDRFASGITLERFPNATVSKGPSNTVSTVSVSSNEIVWTVSDLDLTASHINETAFELTWEVSISPAGSHHYPNNYTLSYNILGEQTNTITFKGDLLNTTIFELEPDSKYFFKLCAKGANEQDEICKNTTVQTKGVLVKHHSAGENYSVIFIVAGCCVLVLFVLITIGICHVRKKKRTLPSYSSYSLQISQFELGSSNTQYTPSQSTSGGANCLSIRNKCFQCETSISEESSLTDSSDFSKKVEAKDKTKIGESGEKLIAQDEKEANNNNVQKRHISCAEILWSNESSVTKNNYQISEQKADSVIIKCEKELTCGESNKIHKDFENQSNSTASELHMSIGSSENSTINTVEEQQVSFNEAGEKVALLKGGHKDNDISDQVLKDGSLEFHECADDKTDCSSFLFKRVELFDAPSLDDFSNMSTQKTAHSSESPYNFNINRNDAHKISHHKDLNMDYSVENHLHALDPPLEPLSAQPYADARFQLPVVNENFPLTPKPDSYDFNRSESLQSNQTSHSSKKPHRKSSSEHKISTVGHVNLNHKISSANGGDSSCDIVAMNNQVSEPTVSVVSSAPCIQGAKINNEASQYQTTEDNHVRNRIHNETIDHRLFEPTLTLPNTQHVVDENKTGHLSTSNRDNEDMFLDRSQRDDSLPTRSLHTCQILSNTANNADKVSNVCTTSVSRAMDCLTPAFFKDLGYFLDPHSSYGNEKSWYGLSLAVLGLPEEKVKSISHHTKGNPEVGHFLATLEYYVADEKHLSDIVQYFVQPHSLRVDVIQYFKKHHKNCAVCNTLYLMVPHGRDISNSTEDVRKVSASHHEGS